LVGFFGITALDSPRFRISDGTANGKIQLEDGIGNEVRETLIQMGHFMDGSEPISGPDRAEAFGVGQIITRNPESGVLCAGSDPRHDGLAIGW